MRLYNRVLLATDFSDTSSAALMHAARLAQRNGAELHVLHVRPALRDTVTRSGPDAHATDDVVGDNELREWIRKCGYEAEVGVTRIVSGGVSAAPHIIRYVEQHAIDLVVMGSHGRGAVASALLGSETKTLVRTAPCSVLVVRRDTPWRAIERIVAPVDLSTHSLAALRFAGELSAQLGAGLTALMALEPLTLPPYLPLELIAKAQQENAAASLKHFVADAELPVDATRVMRDGRAHEVIAEYARQQKSDLIVMSSAGLSGLDRFFTGSVTARVVRTAPCAVLVHRAIAASPEEVAGESVAGRAASTGGANKGGAPEAVNRRHSADSVPNAPALHRWTLSMSY